MIDEKKSILVLDDDLTIRKLLAFHLKNNAYIPYEASCANEGFNILKEKNIDLVLCDVTMDEMDGFTFCRTVRENQNYRTLPFIFVTAKTSIEDKTNALDAGADDFITKPFDVDELLIKVRALLKRTDIYKAYGTKKNIENSFSKSSYKILLLDDDPAITKLFHYNLTKEGFHCVTATNVSEALELVKSYKFDLIISDIMMNEQDGYEFRDILLMDESFKFIPFIFLSSKSDETDILKGYNMEITDYVLKNAGPKVIVAKVNTIIKNIEKEKSKIVNELNVATESLRVKVVPDNSPYFEGFEINHLHKPFQGIPGGDFIDYFLLDENNLAVILGDVMGKKWSAWYFAFAYAGYVRSAIRGVLQHSKEYSPKDILQQVNQYVYQDAKVSEVFATLSILVINKISKTLRYAGAGDLPIIYKQSSQKITQTIKSNGSLLGFVKDGKFTDQAIQLEKNDLILLATDGTIEARSDYGEQFGYDKLINLVNNLNGRQNPLESLEDVLITFTSGKFEDDVSAIYIKALQ
ncbi:MAG: response regulator [Ignavibacteria bacterium RBG_16_34_14]|nr:MAG: response regulator [Ignavibacteria bacterium RBG_16_34_14]